MNTNFNRILEDLKALQGTTVFHVSVKSSLAKGQYFSTLKGILEQCQDNRPAVCGLIGEDLVKSIECIVFS